MISLVVGNFSSFECATILTVCATVSRVHQFSDASCSVQITQVFYIWPSFKSAQSEKTLLAIKDLFKPLFLKVGSFKKPLFLWWKSS